MKSIKPCPFCGAAEVCCPEPEKAASRWYVWCFTCSAEGPTADTEEAAIEMWNRAGEQDDEPKPPKRRLSLSVLINADGWEEVEEVIAELQTELAERGRITNTISGQRGCGFTVELTERPEMTVERYEKELDAWMEQRSRG